MSLELGQNKNYINGIEVGNHFPTMQAFFEICYYLNISPSEFFIEKNSKKNDNYDLNERLCRLPPHIFQHLSQIINDLIENSVY